MSVNFVSSNFTDSEFVGRADFYTFSSGHEMRAERTHLIVKSCLLQLSTGRSQFILDFS